MTFTFVEAEPVVTTVARATEPNPFTEAVQSIALKTNEKTGKPLALSTIMDWPEDEDEGRKLEGQLKRKFKAAGLECNPQCTVKPRVQPAFKVVAGKETSVPDPTKRKIVFWTIPLIQRGTAATEESDTNE